MAFKGGRADGARGSHLGLGETLPFHLNFYQALVVAAFVGFEGTFLAMPRILVKLRGAGIVGRDVNKPGRPEIPEMGGIGIFLGFNAGVFALLLAFPVEAETQILVLAALITCAGAAMTGVIDDLIELRQRFKAFIPLVFAAPLAIYLPSYEVRFPFAGEVDFGLSYPLLLVPLGIACAANSFNMLEGYNGLGAGLGLIMTATLSVLVVLEGRTEALILLLPLGGALLAFLFFNKYPAHVFPGDTMTLLVGAVLAAAAMIGKVEFWGAVLFVPHIAEFWLKARGRFEAENFAKRVVSNPHDPPVLGYDGPTESLTHAVLKRFTCTERGLVRRFWAGEVALSMLVVAGYLASAVL
ncbi:MAG: hypothetical protein ACT4PT_05070 [Methanobacteriota archaeon]